MTNDEFIYIADAYAELNSILNIALEVLQVNGYQQIVEQVNTKRFHFDEKIKEVDSMTTPNSQIDEALSPSSPTSALQEHDNALIEKVVKHMEQS